MLDTHYKLGDNKAWLKSENWLKYNEKPVVAPEYQEECEENKAKIEQ